MFRFITSLFFSLLVLNVNAQSLQVTKATYNQVLPTGIVDADGVSILDGNETIQNGSYTMPGEPDPSIKIYPLANGGAILRENIANFLFYDNFGRIQKTISNSTQSEGGEAISEVAHDPNAKTVVLYNPKIMSDGNTGSRAKLITGSSVPVDIYYSGNRALRTVVVSDNGELIALASMSDGTDDQVQILDRFGNNLGEIEFDQDVKGVSFSENGLFITVYSGGRAAAYEIRSKERVGSTSFRNTSLLYANYSPNDRSIVAVTGSGNESFTELEGHVVNISARQIARADISGSVNTIHQPRLTRTGSGRYQITGFNQTLTMRASF